MKFYGRRKELEILEQLRQISFNDYSQMTVLTGRRRIGKTKLILKSCENTPMVYFFVARTTEAELCHRFAETLRAELNVFVPSGMTSFRELFRFCLEIGTNLKYNLVIDEFQEFDNINRSVFSEIQEIWDMTHEKAHVNLIISGSVYTLMHKIFQDSKEPLYGRASSIIKLKAFTIDTLKTILSDYNPHYTNDDLLCLYAYTGGVPKYVELLMDRGSHTVEKIICQYTEENSLFIEEGNIMLVQEFGKNYGLYLSILTAIAAGFTDVPRISQVTNTTTLGGSLSRLENDYGIIRKKRPIFAKEGSQTVRYEITDHFLRFWLRYITKNQNLIQLGQYERLRDIVKKDYETFSGHELEDYFKDKIMQEETIEQIGSWWQSPRATRANNNDSMEIDIVAIYSNPDRALVAEVKRNRKNFKPERFLEKVEVLKTAHLSKYQVCTKCLTLDDM